MSVRETKSTWANEVAATRSLELSPKQRSVCTGTMTVWQASSLTASLTPFFAPFRSCNLVEISRGDGS